MKPFISAMPFWIVFLFMICFLYSLGFIARPARKAALAAGIKPPAARAIERGIFIFYLIWLLYASILTLNGVFNVNTLPPRVVQLTTLPLLIILFVLIGNTGIYKKLLAAASLESLVRLHIFRLLGIFDIILFCYHHLDPGFAFSSGLGDIITALLSIPVANAVLRNKPGAKKAVFAWNVLGTLDIVVLMILAMMNARKGDSGFSELSLFPFVWFPAFAPATILFLHYSVFKKLTQNPEPSRIHDHKHLSENT